jgi:CheY-like chemotaxis protein
MNQEPVFLYVEDDLDSRDIMRLLLLEMGYSQITIFEDSTDFMARLDKLEPKPTIIFLDIHMKPHSGFELLDMMRNRSEYQEMRIVALTASVMNEEVVTLKNARFNGVVAKPIDPGNFNEVVGAILKGEEVWKICDG